MSDDILLEAKDLTIEYQTAQEPLTAVSNASFKIKKGEYFGLVGESGCGKSTVAKAIVGGLDENGRISSGELLYKDKPLHKMNDNQLNEDIRWKEISFIPQGSMDSLDPLETIEDQAWKTAKIHTDWAKNKALERFRELFEIVGLQESRISDYPHQFSGGMQQRAIIALALFLKPDLIIADEPTTALDVIMQDQVFKYLDEVKSELDTSILLITHDISLVFESTSRVAIMHSGQLCEVGTVKDIYYNPKHPYSMMLQEAFPDHRNPDRKLVTIDGYPPQTTGDVDYCAYESRCPWKEDICTSREPHLEEVDGTEEHCVGCLKWDEIDRDDLDMLKGGTK